MLNHNCTTRRSGHSWQQPQSNLLGLIMSNLTGSRNPVPFGDMEQKKDVIQTVTWLREVSNILLQKKKHFKKCRNHTINEADYFVNSFPASIRKDASSHVLS